MNHWQDNWETIKKRLELLWQGELLDRCCVKVTAPLGNAAERYAAHKVKPQPSDQQGMYEWYNDGEWLLARSRAAIESTYFAGDAYPCVFPYFGTGGHAKYVAPESSVEYAPSTIWVHPCVDDLTSFDFSFDPDTNKVFRRELEVIEYLVSECRGNYLVGATDNCGSYDALAQLYGNERLLCDFIDDPEPVKAAAAKLVDILKRSSERFFAATKRGWQDGAAHGWMNTYSRGNHLQLQCDLSVMISPEIYDEFIRSELVSTARFLEHAVYHFDGIEQIRHLDVLLSIPEINMIQWTQVAGQPPVTEFIPVLRRIQAAGKGLVLIVGREQLKPLCESLSARGVIYITGASNPDEADAIVDYVKNTAKA